MTQRGHEFEQDELRQALRRAFPAEQAPADLRKRVAAMLRGEEVLTSDADVPRPVRLTPPAGLTPFPAHDHEQQSPPGVESHHQMSIAWIGNFFHGARRVALAACFAGLAMGVALFIAMQSSDEHAVQSNSPVAQIADAAQVPAYVAAAVGRHDEVLQPSDPGRPVPGALHPLPQVNSELEKHLGSPLPEADFTPQGWQLVGAKTWKAGSVPVAQIFYRRPTDRDTLSVFILPRDSQGRRAQISTSNLRDHLVATREAENFTVCVVGYSPDGKLTAKEVDRLADMIATH